MRVFSDSYPMNTNMTGLRGLRGFLKKTLFPCALDENNLSIGRINPYMPDALPKECLMIIF